MIIISIVIANQNDMKSELSHCIGPSSNVADALVSTDFLFRQVISLQASTAERHKFAVCDAQKTDKAYQLSIQFFNVDLDPLLSMGLGDAYVRKAGLDARGHCCDQSALSTSTLCAVDIDYRVAVHRITQEQSNYC